MTIEDMQILIDSSGLGFCYLSYDKKILSPNKKFTELVEFRADEINNKSIFELSYPADLDDMQKSFSSAFTTSHEPFQIMQRYLKKDLSHFWGRLTIKPISQSRKNNNSKNNSENNNSNNNSTNNSDNNNPSIYAICTFEDITKQKESDEISLHYQEQVHTAELKQAHAIGISKVTTGVIHNVGNVLNNANISVELILQKTAESSVYDLSKANDILRENIDNFGEFYTSDPRGKMLLQYYLNFEDVMKIEVQDIHSEATQMVKRLQLIQDIINAQQQYAKGRDNFKEEVDLRDIVNSTLALEANALLRSEIKITKKFSEVPLVYAQRTQLIHVIINLIKNAKESMEYCSSPVHKELTIEILPINDNVLLKITDKGRGIQKDNLPKIFNHGYTTKKTGHGFGLHYCANVIHEMGAEISVSSDGVGLGAVFSILFKKQQIEISDAAA